MWPSIQAPAVVPGTRAGSATWAASACSYTGVMTALRMGPGSSLCHLLCSRLGEHGLLHSTLGSDSPEPPSVPTDLRPG